MFSSSTIQLPLQKRWYILTKRGKRRWIMSVEFQISTDCVVANASSFLPFFSRPFTYEQAVLIEDNVDGSSTDHRWYAHSPDEIGLIIWYYKILSLSNEIINIITFTSII